MSALLPVRRATLVDWCSAAPQHTTADGTRTWIVRSANFAVALTEIEGSAVLERADTSDEHMVVVPPGLHASASAGGVTIEAERGDALFIMPPGVSRVVLRGKGLLARAFSRDAADIMALASNRADYAEVPADLPAPVAWPDPADGYRLRHYALAEYSGAANIARIFRSTKLMLNVMDVYPQARDPKKLKPHFHDDCEQITLCMTGRFAHHLRAPWGIDATAWRQDEHIEVGSPSALVIPPRLIHTTQALEGGCWLIDVFGPPRLDFSNQGLVRNAAEYPMPPGT